MYWRIVLHVYKMKANKYEVNSLSQIWTMNILEKKIDFVKSALLEASEKQFW